MVVARDAHEHHMHGGVSGGQVRWQSSLALALSLALTFLVYARALDLAFVNDDIPHILTLQSSSIAEVARAHGGVGGAAYFRPLSTLVLWLMLHIFGPRAPVMYALCLGLHGINVWLLWRLARGLGGTVYAACAAVSWLLFPTHYEAVAYVAAIVHPLSTLMVLLALSAFNRALARGHRRWWCATALLILLAPLAHEQAIVLPLMLILWQVLSHPPGSARAWLASPTPYLALLVVPVLLLRAGSGAALTDALSPTVANTWAGALHVARLVAYPLARFTGKLPCAWQLPLLGCAMAASALVTCWRQRCARLALLGFCWLLVAAAPMLLLIDAQELPSSPRLFYSPSIGIALLYAGPLAALYRATGRSARGLCAILTVLWAALTCIAPLPYLGCALHTLARGSATVRQLVQASMDLAPGESATIVNMPFYMVAPCGSSTSCTSAYPYAAAGMVVLPLYASAADLVRVNGGPSVRMDTVTYMGYAPYWATHGAETSALLLRHRLDNGQRVLAVDLDGPQVLDLGAGLAGEAQLDSRYLDPLRSPPELAAPSEVEAARRTELRWAALRLCGVRSEPSALPGEDLQVTLYWCPEDEDALSQTMVHWRLRDRYGSIVFEDGFPAVAGYISELWDPEVAYATRRPVHVPSNAALGPATLELALSRSGTLLQPLAGTDDRASAWGHLAEVLVGHEHVVPSMESGSILSDARWENGIHLDGWRMIVSPESREIVVTLYWRAEAQLSEDLIVFLHLAGADGVPLSQDDGEPAGGQYPTSRWPPGALIADSRTVRVPPGVDAAELRLLVGLYRWPSLERLNVSVDAAPSADSLILADYGELVR